MEFDDVGMVKLVKKYNLSISSLSICRMLESIEYFFECHGLISFFIGNLPDMTIGSTPYFFNKCIFFKHMVFHLFAHILQYFSKIFKNLIIDFYSHHNLN